jgi:hypothetical protein
MRFAVLRRYLGETCIKTKAVLDDALGGVLFIDEIYAVSYPLHVMMRSITQLKHYAINAFKIAHATCPMC